MTSPTLTKTGIDSTSDAVSSANMMTLANSADTINNNILTGSQAFDRIVWSSAITYTIASGVIDSPTQQLIYIASESGVTDQLDTIGASNNRELLFKAYSGHTITVKNGTGNLTTLDGNDITLTAGMVLHAVCIGSQWSITSTGGVKNNLAAQSDPTPGDDTADGYSYGSGWVNLSLDRAFINTDLATNAAVWKKVTRDVNGWSVKAAAATLSPVGLALPTIANTPANANGTDGTFVTLPTTASSGNLGGFVTTTFNLARLQYDPVFEWLFKMDSTITNLRFWFGLCSADVTNSDTASGSFIGFRYTNGTDTGFTPVCRDGSTQNTGTTIGTVSASTLYKARLRLQSTGTLAYFSINDGAETAFNTNIPAASTDLGAVFRPITTTTAIRLVNFSYFKAGW